MQHQVVGFTRHFFKKKKKKKTGGGGRGGGGGGGGGGGPPWAARLRAAFLMELLLYSSLCSAKSNLKLIDLLDIFICVLSIQISAALLH